MGYLVRVTQASNGNRRQVTSTDATVTVSSLTPYTQYFVNVAARTVNGTGPFSESSEVTTLEAGEKGSNFFRDKNSLNDSFYFLALEGKEENKILWGEVSIELIESQ